MAKATVSVKCGGRVKVGIIAQNNRKTDLAEVGQTAGFSAGHFHRYAVGATHSVVSVFVKRGKKIVCRFDAHRVVAG